MSYTLAYQGAEIDDILGRAAPGGALDTAIAAKQDALTFDAVPTQGSTNPAESGGIYDAIQAGGATALAAFATDTVSGDVVSFPDGADGIPVKSFVGSIIPAQSGSGDPSPTNVRPISGWTGAKITDVNDLTKQPYFGGLLNGSYGFANLGQLSWIVVAAGTSRERFQTQNLKTLVMPPANNYTVANMISNGLSSATAARVANDDNVINEIGMYANGVIEVRYPSVHNTTDFIAAMSDVYLIYELATATSPTITDADYSMLLEKFSTGFAVGIDWTDEAGTVYAGTLTALGGGLWKIQPTHAIVDMGSLSYAYADYGQMLFHANLTGAKAGAVVCESFRDASAYGWANMPAYSVRTGGGIVRVRDSDYTDATAFKAAVTGVKLVYPLADASLPAPITITGEDLQTLLGANTVWTDVGAVTGMTYRADTALYIQKLIGGGGTLSLSMASPSPSLSLGRVGVLAEQEEAEPEQTEEEAEQLEQTEEPEQTEEA